MKPRAQNSPGTLTQPVSFKKAKSGELDEYGRPVYGWVTLADGQVCQVDRESETQDDGTTAKTGPLWYWKSCPQANGGRAMYARRLPAQFAQGERTLTGITYRRHILSWCLGADKRKARRFIKKVRRTAKRAGLPCSVRGSRDCPTEIPSVRRKEIAEQKLAGTYEEFNDHFVISDLIDQCHELNKRIDPPEDNRSPADIEREQFKPGTVVESWSTGTVSTFIKWKGEYRVVINTNGWVRTVRAHELKIHQPKETVEQANLE